MVFLISLLACGDTNHSDAGGSSEEDQALADSLWDAIQDYDTWGNPPNWGTTPVLSDSHSGAYVVIWIDDTLSAWDATGSAPEGAIAVKEAFADEAGTTLKNYTVMQKIAGYDSAHGDWFWAAFSPDGVVSTAGQVEGCYSCHADGNDYMLFE